MAEVSPGSDWFWMRYPLTRAPGEESLCVMVGGTRPGLDHASSAHIRLVINVRRLLRAELAREGLCSLATYVERKKLDDNYLPLPSDRHLDLDLNRRLWDRQIELLRAAAERLTQLVRRTLAGPSGSQILEGATITQFLQTNNMKVLVSEIELALDLPVDDEFDPRVLAPAFTPVLRNVEVKWDRSKWPAALVRGSLKAGGGGAARLKAYRKGQCGRHIARFELALAGDDIVRDLERPQALRSADLAGIVFQSVTAKNQGKDPLRELRLVDPLNPTALARVIRALGAQVNTLVIEIARRHLHLATAPTEDELPPHRSRNHRTYQAVVELLTTHSRTRAELTLLAGNGAYAVVRRLRHEGHVLQPRRGLFSLASKRLPPIG